MWVVGLFVVTRFWTVTQLWVADDEGVVGVAGAVVDLDAPVLASVRVEAAWAWLLQADCG